MLQSTNESLQEKTGLKDVELRNSEYGEDELSSTLAKILANNPNLESLVVSFGATDRHPLTMVQFERVLQMVIRSNILYLSITMYGEVCLTFNPYRSESPYDCRYWVNYKPIIKFLKTNPPLKSLYLNFSGAQECDDIPWPEDMEMLQQVCKEYNTHLKHSNIFMRFRHDSRRCARDPSIQIFVDSYNASVNKIKNLDPSLVNLAFSYPDFKLYDGHLEQLIPIIAGNHYVQIIDFRKNQLGDKGALLIANLIIQSINIKHIDVSGNCIGATGIEALRVAAAARPDVMIVYTAQQLSLLDSISSSISGFASLLFSSSSIGRAETADEDEAPLIRNSNDRKLR